MLFNELEVDFFGGQTFEAEDIKKGMENILSNLESAFGEPYCIIKNKHKNLDGVTV